jgi:hypothetical protein
MHQTSIISWDITFIVSHPIINLNLDSALLCTMSDDGMMKKFEN